MMRTSDEIKVRLNRGIYELRQAQQSLGTVQGRIQTVVNEIQVQSDRADLIDPAIDALNRQIFTLNEDMDRVYSLRNDESDLYLKQENAKLKSDIAELKRAHRREVEQLQAQLANSTKSNEELIHRAQSVERFNDLLKTKINEMKQQYENAIIDNVDLRDTNADLQDTVVSLQSTPGKFLKCYSSFLDSTDDLQPSMSLRILPIPTAALPRQQRPLAKQWLRRTADLL